MAEVPKEESIGLLRKIASGDRIAFARFYDLFAPFVFSFALRLLRNRTDAEDLLQEVFVQIWRQASSYDKSRGVPEAWVSIITKNKAIDRMRSLRSRERGVEGLGKETERREGEFGDRDSAKIDARLIAQTSLAKIPADERKALEMVYFDGLTQAEVAEKLGTPLGTVKTRIRSGLQRLRGLLGEENTEKTYAAR